MFFSLVLGDQSGSLYRKPFLLQGLLCVRAHPFIFHSSADIVRDRPVFSNLALTLRPS